MTADDKQVERFFDAVARVIAGKNFVRVAFHYPAPECFDGSCQEVGVFLTGTFTRMCNWGDLLNLAAWFLKHGPEVDDDWERVALARRFDPDTLHDLFLAIFLGSEKGPNFPRPLFTLADAKVGNIIIRMPKTSDLKETL